MRIKALVALYFWILEFDDVTCIRSTVIIRLTDELCISDDHVSKLVPRVSLLPAHWNERGREEENLGTRCMFLLTRIHHYAKYDWLRQVDGQVIQLTFIGLASHFPAFKFTLATFELFQAKSVGNTAS